MGSIDRLGDTRGLRDLKDRSSKFFNGREAWNGPHDPLVGYPADSYSLSGSANPGGKIMPADC